MPENNQEVTIQWVKDFQEKVNDVEAAKIAEEFMKRQPQIAHNDSVNHPQHYTQGGIECIEAIKASMSTIEFQGYLKGNCLKYLWRWRAKGGKEDLKKARVYLDWLIKTCEVEE